MTPATMPVQLRAAIASGAQHIIVQQHMDLSSLPASEQVAVLGVALDTTLSITGACATAPGPELLLTTGADLQPLLLGQCLLLTDTSVLTINNSSLWMDNLYLRLQRSSRTAAQMSLLTTETESPALYLSNITLQGAGTYAHGTGVRGLTAGGPTYVEGCQFSHLGGSTHVVYSNNAPLRVVNTHFTDNAGADEASAVMYTYRNGGIVWLQGSVLIHNSMGLPLIAGYNSGGFVSDVPQVYFSENSEGFKDTSVQPGDASVFLTGTERWLKDVQAVTAEFAALASAERCIQPQAHLGLRNVDSAAAYHVPSYLLGTVRSGTNTIRGVGQQPQLEDEPDNPDQPALAASARALTNVATPSEVPPGLDSPVDVNTTDSNSRTNDKADGTSPTGSGNVSIENNVEGSDSTVTIGSSYSSSDSLLVKLLVPLACALITTW
eukprot:jgi/Ulvmu1/8597/UM045_0040.1